MGHDVLLGLATCNVLVQNGKRNSRHFRCSRILILCGPLWICITELVRDVSKIVLKDGLPLENGVPKKLRSSPTKIGTAMVMCQPWR